MLVFLGIFLANLLSAFLTTNRKIKKCFRNYQITHNIAKNTDILHLIYTSYCNIFLITRIISTQSASNINLAILLQPLHFLLGFIFLCVFLSTDHPNYVFYNKDIITQIASGSTATSVLVCGFITIIVSFVLYDFYSETDQTDEKLETSDVELGSTGYTEQDLHTESLGR